MSQLAVFDWDKHFRVCGKLRYLISSVLLLGHKKNRVGTCSIVLRRQSLLWEIKSVKIAQSLR